MKTAVVLFNLGGPDAPEAVRPFLFNLFSDRAIITLPQPFRFLLAWWISSRRASIAQKIYAKIGGKSPLLELTNMQARALEKTLGSNYKVFTCMRYWHPMTKAVAGKVKNYAPDAVVLLPLYPQFSTTTAGSSFEQWDKEVKAQGLAVPTKRACCYPDQMNFISAHVALIKESYKKMAGAPRALFSAHGLPEKFIAAGDPYQWQVERTVAAIVAALAIADLDYRICYQSRVGRLAWIGPSIDEEISCAGKDGKSLLVVPVAFVSEHSETLVELDIEYRHIAQQAGVPSYVRVPALGTHPDFIAALARLCVDGECPIGSSAGGRVCPVEFNGCPCQ